MLQSSVQFYSIEQCTVLLGSAHNGSSLTYFCVLVFMRLDFKVAHNFKKISKRKTKYVNENMLCM